MKDKFDKLINHLRADIRRERTPEEIAEQEALLLRINNLAVRPLQGVLLFCECIGIAALLWAGVRATTGLDQALIGAMLTALALSLWVASQSIWPLPPTSKRAIDEFNKMAFWRAVLALGFAALLMWVGFRLALVFEELQFGAKNPEPAPVVSMACPAVPACDLQPAAAPKSLPAKPKTEVGPRD